MSAYPEEDTRESKQESLTQAVDTCMKEILDASEHFHDLVEKLKPVLDQNGMEEPSKAVIREQREQTLSSVHHGVDSVSQKIQDLKCFINKVKRNCHI